MTINPHISLPIARLRAADLGREVARWRTPARRHVAPSRPSARWQAVKRAHRHLIPAGAGKR
jgi:hypothetical protein